MESVSLRIDRDIAIFIEDGAARFRPPYRNPETVVAAVLNWQDGNPDHPRADFVEEWVQLFELPAHLFPSISEAEHEKELKAARSIKRLIKIFAQLKVKKGVPENVAHMEAEREVRQFLREIDAMMKSPENAL